MRSRKTKDGLTVLAVAGTNVVLLGFNLPKAKTTTLMGFGVQRTDHASGETVWMRGFKRFPSTDPGTAPGESLSTREHPIQSFQWADYTVNPGASYSYRVVALHGAPETLKEVRSVTVDVDTEAEGNTDGALTHHVFFNRGAAASQAYQARFGERSPDEVGDPAFAWLSRGLYEAFDAFLARAKSNKWKLRAALYECHYEEPMRLFKRAKTAGADVRIVYDARKQTPTPKEKVPLGKKNAATIKKLGLTRVSIARKANPSYIAHNKFIVLLEGDTPRAVWTGSMNLSKNGIYGQANVGHVVEDPKVAKAFFEYWQRLATDPEGEDLRPENEDASSIDSGPIKKGTTVLFSPRSGNAQLERIATLISEAQHAAFLTLPFGIVSTVAPSLTQDDGVLRCILLDSRGNTDGHKTALKNARALPNVIAAVGNRIQSSALDAWVQEAANPWSTNVEYVHTKFLLIDPLSNDPIVVTGSANFSDPSVESNDENTLVIRGDKRVADIYLTEFKRLFDHHAFREMLANNHGRVPDPSPLKEEPADWLSRHFDNGGPGELRRRYFSGS
ncbi:MAG: hypothetical protein IT353_21665 [Gemmatimonadaceae bacterium]|nr:hypothetical protein [Gemmatimonadaceae bacterium]